MNELEFPIHKPARTSLTVVAVLLMLLCVTFPAAIYLLVRLSQMKVKLTASGLEALGFLTDKVEFDQVERFGVLHVPVVAGGLGGYLARMKLNHMSEGLNLVFLLKNGKTIMTMPRVAVVRTWILNHLVHHRGQLSVYLRLTGSKVPSIYGPSADDAGGM